MVRGLIRYCVCETSSLMCHNSLSEPYPHLVRWLMGISIIGFPITTLLTSLLRILPLLTSHPEIPPGPNRSVWNKCQTQFGSGVNSHKHGWHTECDSSFYIAEGPVLLFYRCFPAVVFRWWQGDELLWTKEDYEPLLMPVGKTKCLRKNKGHSN